jgi:hypothetical protein
MDTPTEQDTSTVDSVDDIDDVGAVRVADRWVVPCSDALDRARGLTIRLTPEETILGFPAGSTAIMSPGHVRAVCLLADLSDLGGDAENMPDPTVP